MSLLFNNWQLKLTALIAAIILWFIVIAVENTVYKFPQTFKVKALNVSNNLTLDRSLPEVSLYLRVDKEILKSLTPSDFEVFIDLEDMGAGDMTVPIEITAKNALAKVLKIEPSVAVFKLAPAAEKEVEVRIKTEGQPAPGYILQQVEPQSGTATISGAQSVLDTIEFVEAKLILGGTETTSINQNVKLTLPSSIDVPNELVLITPEQRSVRAVINAETIEKEVKVTPVFSQEQERWEAEASIDPKTVTITGGADTLKDITEMLTFSINANLLQGGLETSANLQIPEGVTVKGPTSTIRVTPPEPDADEEIDAPA